MKSSHLADIRMQLLEFAIASVGAEKAIAMAAKFEDYVLHGYHLRVVSDADHLAEQRQAVTEMRRTRVGVDAATAEQDRTPEETASNG